MGNLEERDKFLEKYNLPRLNQEEIENINIPITRTEIKTVVKNLLTNESPGPDGFTGEFYQTFREKLITPSISNSSETNSRGKTFPNSFYKAIIILISKAGKDNHKKKKITDQYH